MARTYKQLTLTDEILNAALARAESLPVFEGSHRGQAANFVGCLGERVFERLLAHSGVPYEDRRGSTRTDYIVNGKYSVEVKTKDRTVRPKLSFENSVPVYNHQHQRPDYYYFVSLLRDADQPAEDLCRYRAAFLLGGIDLQTLEEVGKRWGTGEVDPSNGTRFWTACINVSMDALISNTDLIELFKR